MQKTYSTEYSQAVTHPSTNSALCCLTAVIRRELVLPTWYGRRCNYIITIKLFEEFQVEQISGALVRVELNVDNFQPAAKQ